jgi:hypothetical protein
MINPVNSNKTVNTTTDRAGTTHNSGRSDAVSGNNPARSQDTEAVLENSGTPDIENARQLYQMEQTRGANGVSLETSAQARSVLDNLLQQISESPARAASAQLSQISRPMGNLLKLMPA